VPVYVALLRGINLAGHNAVPMKDLRLLFEALPADSVTTYLQSGNVVFRSGVEDPGRLATAVEQGLRAERGLDVSVLVRPADDVDRVAAANPFLGDRDERDASTLHVTFLAALPEPARVAAMESAAAAAAPDALRVGEREVYLWCPNGYGRTKLNNAFFEKKLAMVATTRNWRTVTTLAGMARTSREADAPP